MRHQLRENCMMWEKRHILHKWELQIRMQPTMEEHGESSHYKIATRCSKHDTTWNSATTSGADDENCTHWDEEEDQSSLIRPRLNTEFPHEGDSTGMSENTTELLVYLKSLPSRIPRPIRTIITNGKSPFDMPMVRKPSRILDLSAGSAPLTK